MGDVMLHGVLRMPPELWGNNVIDREQRYSRCIQASSRLRTYESISYAITKALEDDNDVQLALRLSKIADNISEIEVFPEVRLLKYTGMYDRVSMLIGESSTFNAITKLDIWEDGAGRIHMQYIAEHLSKSISGHAVLFNFPNKEEIERVSNYMQALKHFKPTR